jgi:hypothetical protein
MTHCWENNDIEKEDTFIFENQKCNEKNKHDFLAKMFVWFNKCSFSCYHNITGNYWWIFSYLWNQNHQPFNFRKIKEISQQIIHVISFVKSIIGNLWYIVIFMNTYFRSEYSKVIWCDLLLVLHILAEKIMKIKIISFYLNDN